VEAFEGGVVVIRCFGILKKEGVGVLSCWITLHEEGVYYSGAQMHTLQERGVIALTPEKGGAVALHRKEMWGGR
jgi:hypothetical protein